MSCRLDILEQHTFMKVGYFTAVFLKCSSVADFDP